MHVHALRKVGKQGTATATKISFVFLYYTSVQDSFCSLACLMLMSRSTPLRVFATYAILHRWFEEPYCSLDLKILVSLAATCFFFLLIICPREHILNNSSTHTLARTQAEVKVLCVKKKNWPLALSLTFFFHAFLRLPLSTVCLAFVRCQPLSHSLLNLSFHLALLPTATGKGTRRLVTS